ncbi:hypothetical protein [Dictyobacter kobayashii]|uniref:Uncharacterized protein n=1 Tax=Dictyobacter kobayashii TaxID=2014872 RepID=A0A402AUX1_9CHLR|nr:hypothetical protein [Dictyobacter kobayashii]GCE22887.1 hypothetical protein KDK_66870 [Dictyobacter kobayashii]
MIITILALVLIIACVGSVVFVNKYINGNTTDTNTNTPTVTTPSGNPIDPQASAIIIHPQTAGAIDKTTLEPKAGTIKTTFKVNDPIYVTFNLDPNKYDVTKEKSWVNVRFYKGKQSILKDDPLAVDKEETVGYFGAQYYLATPDGAAEIYWCHTSTCSDGKLAQVVHFTVTN